MYTQISNSDNIIDSQEVIDRLGELELSMEVARENEEEPDEDEVEELRILQEFADEASSVSDWEYGEQFIHDNYFTEYAEELAKDLYGAELVDAEWPHRHIDWDEAAEELKQDYTSFDFGGETYWARG